MSETVDSGVFYIGQIPNSWSCTRIGHVCEKLERSCEMADPTLICSNQGNVVYREGKSMGQISDKLSAFQGVQEGDLLIHGMDTWHGAVAVSSLKGKCSGVVHVCESSQNKRFLAYYLRTHAFHGVYKAITNGVRGNTSDLRSWAKARTLYIAFPSLQLQGKIADYLDRKSAAIDELVSRRQQMIEKLRELKKSIIADAVTKGIRPGRAMKDSGVPWLGGVPESWDSIRLAAVFSERKEINTDMRQKFILSVLKEVGVIPYSEKGNIGNKCSEDISRYKIVHENDIVMNSMNVIIGSVGLSRYEGCLSPVYYVLRPIEDKGVAKFYNYVFLTKKFQAGIKHLGKGILEHRMRIPMSSIRAVMLPHPTKAEQQEIVEYLDRKCAAIDEMITRHTGIVDKLKELKVSLVSNVVTGKVDIRVEE